MCMNNPSHVQLHSRYSEPTSSNRPHVPGADPVTLPDNDPWIESHSSIQYSRGALDRISKNHRPPHAATSPINHAISVLSPPIPSSALDYYFIQIQPTYWARFPSLSDHVAEHEWPARASSFTTSLSSLFFFLLCIRKASYVGSASAVGQRGK